MVQVVLGMAERPRPDDAADALAIAVWGANTAGSLLAQGAAGVAAGGTGAATAGVLDRAAVAPITRGATGYERAVREALALERSTKRTAS
jgi:hypothetical protein